MKTTQLIKVGIAVAMLLGHRIGAGSRTERECRTQKHRRQGRRYGATDANSVRRVD
ncbi:MAG TPA: hypothetical protein VI358_01800 [Pseudolabrys sp.]